MMQQRSTTCGRLVRREAQKIYRERQKRLEAERRERVATLKTKIRALNLYNGILMNDKVAALAHSVQMRFVMLGIYADLFEFGVTKSDPFMYAKQKTFLQHICHPDAFVQSKALDRGFQGFLQQWEMYTTLHDHFTVNRVSIQRLLGHAGDVIRMETQISLILTHRTIVALYPHMMLDYTFLDRVVGQTLEFKGSQTFSFNSDGQVVALHCEMDIATAWFGLLKDPVLVGRVLKQKRIEDGCIKIDS